MVECDEGLGVASRDLRKRPLANCADPDSCKVNERVDFSLVTVRH